MKIDITTALVEEHKLILRMIALLERNAQRTAEGTYTNWRFYRDGIGFIRQYADRFHHAKEEDVLFTALIANGMPRQHSPVAAMLMEHDLGRTFVRNLEEAVNEAEAGRKESYARVAENALDYAALLRDHIAKEDGILYPLAERIIPDTMRDDIVSGYRAAETETPADLGSRYRRIVEQYEQE